MHPKFLKILLDFNPNAKQNLRHQSRFRVTQKRHVITEKKYIFSTRKNIGFSWNTIITYF